MGFTEFAALLPPPLQFMAYVLAAVISYFLVRTEYRKRRDGPAPDLIVAGGSLTDMKPIREMNEHLAHLVSHTAAQAIATRATADALMTIAEIMRKKAEGEHMEDEIERRLRDALARMPKG